MDMVSITDPIGTADIGAMDIMVTTLHIGA